MHLLSNDGPDRERGGEPGRPLRSWLRGSWAVVFSHPQDFRRCDFELDRWLAVIRRAFAHARVRALSVARASAGWSAHADGEQCTLLFAGGDPAERALAAHLSQFAGRRFVLVIDERLSVRRTYSYDALTEVPSPLEFLGWAQAARERTPLTAAGAAPRRLRLAGGSP